LQTRVTIADPTSCTADTTRVETRSCGSGKNQRLLRLVETKPEPAPARPESPKSVAEVQPAAPPTPAPAKSAPSGSVKERILALAVEKTGYPQDMLDLDLDLEADLGVDTVKQAEIFAAIREMYNIPRDENRKLRDYPTLAHVIRFVYEKRPDLAEELRLRLRSSNPPR
jgi:acyl carrier protein